MGQSACYAKGMAKELKVGAHRYALEIVANQDGDCGSTDFIKGVISIHADMSLSMRGSTLIHEAFHAFNPTLGEEHTAHALLDSLSDQMYTFLFENDLLDMKRLSALLDVQK